MEVGDLHRRPVVAGRCSCGQPCPGGAGEGGSSPDKAGTCQYCQMVWCGERDEEECTRNQRYYVPEGLTGSNLGDMGRVRSAAIPADGSDVELAGGHVDVRPSGHGEVLWGYSWRCRRDRVGLLLRRASCK